MLVLKLVLVFVLVLRLYSCLCCLKALALGEHAPIAVLMSQICISKAQAADAFLLAAIVGSASLKRATASVLRQLCGAGKRTVHLIVSRTATGSSVRFVAAFASAFLASPWGVPPAGDGRDRSPLAHANSAHSPSWLAWELGNSSLVRSTCCAVHVRAKQAGIASTRGSAATFVPT